MMNMLIDHCLTGDVKIASVLHHSMHIQLDKEIPEIWGIGWHFKTAKALRDIGRFDALCIRPHRSRYFRYRVIHGIPLVLAPISFPSKTLNDMFIRDLSILMANLVKRLVSKEGFIPYVHGYRALNSAIILSNLKEYPMILQHHGSPPPNNFKSSFLPIYYPEKGVRFIVEHLLKKVRGVIFVLTEFERDYLLSLGVEAYIIRRDMAIDFKKLTVVDEEEKKIIRAHYGFPPDSILLFTYVGEPKREISVLKGAHLITKIYNGILNRVNRRINMVAVGVGKSLVPLLRSIGVHAYPYLPHNEYLSLLKASDLYFLPATRQIFYGGIAMALVEALALGKPVVSPTLIHYPEKKIIPHIGITPPYMDSEASLNKFVDALSYAIENISLFKVERYRDNIARYYSWESFVRDFAMAVNRL